MGRRARDRLANRGWVGADGQLTSAGQAAHDAVETATDWAAARPWARLGAETTAGIAEALTPLAQACAAGCALPQPHRRPGSRRRYSSGRPAGANPDSAVTG